MSIRYLQKAAPQFSKPKKLVVALINKCGMKCALHIMHLKAKVILKAKDWDTHKMSPPTFYPKSKTKTHFFMTINLDEACQSLHIILVR